ncbi:MAG: hypothetical protein IJ867_04255 [Clostridia bacterium]|nr:hypothetical protein [Clostridia bacterium]
MEKKNLEKIYEKFIEDVEPTEEMKQLYDELAEKMISIKNNLSDKQAEELDELEELYSKVNSLETKEAFFKGFSVATNLVIEAKE